MIYHPKEFRKAIESEDEEDYLKEIKADAEIKLELQAEKQLYDLLYSEYNAEYKQRRCLWRTFLSQQDKSFRYYRIYFTSVRKTWNQVL